MIIRFYKVYFYATDIKCKKKQLIPVFIPKTKTPLSMEQQIEMGTQTLIADGYCDISYGSTIITELIFAD